MDGVVKRCVLCNRRVSDTAKVVPGLGAFGSECATKVAGFETLLEHHHAVDLAVGIFVPMNAPQERSRELSSLVAKLKSAGIKVISTPREDGFELRLGGVGTPSRARPFLRKLGRELEAAA